MTMTLEGSCRCGAVTFSVETHAPVPYQLCYCSICRKQQGGGGYAINLSALTDTLDIGGEVGRDAIGVFRAEIHEDDGHCRTSSGERNFCTRCGAGLWLFDPSWPDLLHPFASAIDTPLPVPPTRVHMMLDFKAPWVEVTPGPEDQMFDRYPEESIEAWHKARGLWVD
ncbi:GFA family protein [Mesobaculum littorinae]|uniref:GFA family protein n=1 Tax=Mesobaculum littorinae TaxID=2486419 RepID=A0A438AMP0_9RHOB|nr:GFA family protein [Mesobaculum littorinae]RVV99885.1 GFA family protein [Mesobaculum littorinae]